MKSRVQNFMYGGMFVQPIDGLAPYTATFKNWTEDPGIARCQCSDGKERLIPSCMFVDKMDLPKQDTSAAKRSTKTSFYLGVPSRS